MCILMSLVWFWNGGFRCASFVLQSMSCSQGICIFIQLELWVTTQFIVVCMTTIQLHMTRIVNIQTSGANEQNSTTENQQRGWYNEENQKEPSSLVQIVSGHYKFRIVGGVKTRVSWRCRMISSIIAMGLIKTATFLLQCIDTTFNIDHQSWLIEDCYVTLIRKSNCCRVHLVLET